ncbi:MAG: hypothetical protein Q9M29_08300, partial [Mariprofundaceae bacterium]|nr:hypothetical protein [Mariprofundaceae bacterium]
MTSRRFRTGWILAGLLFLLPVSARARLWQATQGDVLGVEKSLPAGHIEVRAWGISWPFRRLGDGRVKAWIGVDMKTRPGTHPLLWEIKQADGRIT